MTKPTANFPFEHEQASESTGLLLWQTTAIWQRAITAALRPHGLTQVQFVLLASLLWLSHQGVQITQVMLAKQARLDIMMTSQVLRALEARALLQRLPHPSDTRARMLVLTDAGRALAQGAVPDVEAVDRQFFGVLGDERAPFNAALRSLIAPLA